MNLSAIKRSVRALSPSNLSKLDAWLHELINAAESKKQALDAKKLELLKEHQSANKTYRLEGVRCGKETCKCVEGALHGPYWYAYWTEGGKTKSQYVGKKLPRGVKTRKGSNKRGVR